MQVVVRLLQYFERTVLYGADEAFGNGVGYSHVIIVGEVAFQRVHDDIYYAGCRLIGRQCKGALRVHYGKLAAELIAAVVFFRSPSSLVMTVASLISLPAAGRVSTAPKGRQVSTSALWVKKSQTSPS